MDWLLAPIDATRTHEVAGAIAWHGRLMVLAWGVLVPGAILVARFYKVWPGQNWPDDLDNPAWWRIHWVTQSVAIAMALVALLLVFQSSHSDAASFHKWLGYGVIVLGAIQVVGGMLRGSKGGHTDTQMRGDHFDMSRRRVLFEIIHKSMGYVAALFGGTAILSGLWKANAPNWMFLAICLFWCALAAIFLNLQVRGRALDTYQAIWGADPELPGNQRNPIGWGISRGEQNADKR
jgi:hypothetical protein